MTIYGRIIIIIFTIMILFLSGCILINVDPCGPYVYRIEFLNETNETIDLLLIPTNYGKAIKLIPDSIVDYSGFCLDEDEDVILDGLFPENHDVFWNEISIRWQDSLIHTWTGPPRELHDSVHHFFNYNSWEYLPKESNPEEYWYVRFIIQEKDLVPN